MKYNRRKNQPHPPVSLKLEAVQWLMKIIIEEPTLLVSLKLEAVQFQWLIIQITFFIQYFN
jgi:hypothetical protein